MEQLDKVVRFSDFEGDLPKPKHFPSRVRFAVKGYPGAITDNNMLDLFASENTDVDSPSLSQDPVDRLLEQAKGGESLSDPKYIGWNRYYEYFICFTGDKQPVSIQTRYYQYFYYRYKGCQFLSSEPSDPVGVMDKDSNIVGLIMPMLVRQDLPFYEE